MESRPSRRRGRSLPFFIILALSATGCVATTVSKAVNGKAYVVKGNVFGTSVYNCEVASSGPVCYEVTEEPLP